MDPISKLDYLNFSLASMDELESCGSLFSIVKSFIFELFEVYVSTYASADAGCDRQSSVPFESNQSASAKGGSMLKAKFKKHK